MNTKLRDVAERTAATAVEAGIAYLATRLVDVGPVWVLVGTPVLAAAKSWIATRFGQPESASLDPTV